MQYVMGIDNGSTMTKAALYDLQGNELATCGAKLEAIMPAPGYYERDMQGIWSCNIQAIAGVIQKSGINPKDIIAISPTGHGNGGHFIGHDGTPVCNSIEGADMRAIAYVQKFIKSGIYDKIHPLNMQALWPALSILVMAWLRDNRPEILSKTKYFMNVTDYVRYMLTGQAHLEISVTCGSGLINTKERKIDPSMLAMAGLEEIVQKLPPIIGSTELCGHVTAEAAKLSGLCQGTPVVAGCYDIDAAAIATGALTKEYMTVIAGTWCNNQFVSQTPVVSKEFFSTTAFADGVSYLMLEGSPTSASNLEWFVSELLQTETAQAKAGGLNPYKVCDDALQNTAPHDSDIIFVPFLYGSNAHPYAKGSFIGLQGFHKREHLIRAVFEGICFSHRWHMEKLLQYTPAPKAIRIAGGAAKSAIWVQLFADILGTPMELTAATELGTLGAAICATVGAGIYPDLSHAASQMVRRVKTVAPNPQLTVVYDEKFAKYKKAIACLDSYWG